MNKSEFTEWLDYHTRCFPSVQTWVAKHDTIVIPWEETLADASLADAKEVSRLMSIGDLDLPSGYGDHARFVRKKAKEIAFKRSDAQSSPSYIGDERVFNCPDCEDEGFVRVVDPEHWKAGRFRDCSVFCNCSKGGLIKRRKSSNPRARRGPVYDPKRMFKVAGLCQAEYNAFVEWLETHHPVYRDVQSGLAF